MNYRLFQLLDFSSDFSSTHNRPKHAKEYASAMKYKNQKSNLASFESILLILSMHMKCILDHLFVFKGVMEWAFFFYLFTVKAYLILSFHCVIVASSFFFSKNLYLQCFELPYKFSKNDANGGFYILKFKRWAPITKISKGGSHVDYHKKVAPLYNS